MSPSPRCRLRGVALVGALWLASPAWAQPTPESREQARVLYENGAMLYEEGQYEKAITAWEEAYRLSLEPAMLYNIANAWERVGRIDLAIDKLNDYRVYAPESDREAIGRRLRALEARLAAQPEPQPTVPVMPAAPTPVTVAPREQHPKRVAGIALLAVGVGSAGAGAGLYATAASAASTARESCTSLDGGWLCLDTADAPASRSRSFAVGGHVSWAAAAALLGTGVALIAIDKPGGGNVVLLPAPTFGGAGLVLHVSL